MPTVWPAAPHTLAKHAILQHYLNAWLPILTRQAARLTPHPSVRKAREVLFIDGFAGPGAYEKGEPGSPLIAITAALQHAAFPLPVRMVFVEQREDRFQHLRRVIAPYQERARQSHNISAVEVRQGDCTAVLNDLLDEHERHGIVFGPALAFLDQFGYGEVPMDLIARILRYDQCEVFSYLDYKDMNRWISDKTKAPAFRRAYGGDEWQDCIHLPEHRRRACLLAAYKAALKDPKRGNAKYVTSFVMFDAHDQPLYWLLFCTNNLRGLEEMKRAMWSVDKTGGFRFSDRDNPEQLSLLDDCFSQDWLADELTRQLTHRTLTVAEVKEYALEQTPCCLFKNALRRLETQDRTVSVVQAPPGRKSGQYPDQMLGDITVRFEASLFGGLD
jgi:three-Cys-motif partner protein